MNERVAWSESTLASLLDSSSRCGRAVPIGFDPAHGLEPWLSDGTAEGTVLVDDINPGSSASIPEGAPGRFTNVAGTVLFTAADSCIDPTRLRCDFEPWKTVPRIR